MNSLVFMFGICAQFIIYCIGSQDSAPPTTCYGNNGTAQRCIPRFRNAAAGLPVEASNICGNPQAKEFCHLGNYGPSCTGDRCDDGSPSLRHPPEYMTDSDSRDNLTWWQSDSLNDGLLTSHQIDLTFNLGKTYMITNIVVRFHSMRPESFVIYKKTSEDSPWTPYQYFSSSCQSTYQVAPHQSRTSVNGDDAICTDEYSDLTPLTGGTAIFNGLTYRQGAHNFDNSPVLQEWTRATNIRIVLSRMNTFGDEIFQDQSVLKAYYYAISDVSILARCECNGHADRCLEVGETETRLACDCHHNTTGPDCDECLPSHNDQPWARATAEDVQQCQPCECNGFADECSFDKALFRKTGHGSHCIACRDNRDGPNCLSCKAGYSMMRGKCLNCNCNIIGSVDTMCDKRKCNCKPGVAGYKCNRCRPGYTNFGPSGCRPTNDKSAAETDGEKTKPRLDIKEETLSNEIVLQVKTLSNDITSQVEALSNDIARLSAAYNDQMQTISGKLQVLETQCTARGDTPT